MKSYRLSTYARIALILTVAGVMTACVSSPHYRDPYPSYSARVTYYDYWYYPAIGAYYDPRAHNYIYYEHDHWNHAQALPPRMRSHLGHHVTVRSKHDRPYEEHHRHRQQYQPERYRERHQTHHGDGVWIGAPRQPSPQHGHDVRRVKSHDRDRNDKHRRYQPERDAVAVPPRYREPDVRHRRQGPDQRAKNLSRHREPRVTTIPIKREGKWRQPEIRKEKAGVQYRNDDARRKQRHQQDHGKPGSSTLQPRQHRAPVARRQPPTTPPKSVPGHRKLTTKTAPAKQDKKRHQRENRKEDAKHRYREEDNRRGNGSNHDAERSPKRYRRPYEQYQQDR